MPATEPPAGVTPTTFRRVPLTTRERWLALAIGLAPIPLTALVLAPFAARLGASAGDVAAAALVYGGLLGLAAGVVTIDRLQARQCPRCGARNERGTPACSSCRYDLNERPRYACDERHLITLEPGMCACGRRLKPLPVARGIGREVVWMLKVGAWLAAFLFGVAALLTLVERGV